MMTDDPLLHVLSGLPRPDPDPARAAEVRRRCHAAMAHRRGVRPSRAVAGDLFRRVLAPALVAAGCAVYLVEVIRRAAALFGF